MRQRRVLFQDIGFNRRMSNIFKVDGKTLVIGIDHGTSMGLLEGLEDIGDITRQFLEAKSDGILLGPKASTWLGTTLEKNIDTSLLMRLNRTNVFDRTPPEKWSVSMVAEVEDAVRLGADAVVLWYIRDLGGSKLSDNFEEIVTRTASKCRSLGIPLVVEALTLGSDDEVEQINTARIAYELGADILKINYPNSLEALKKIVNVVDAPVLLAGGPGSSDINEFYELMKKSMKTGIKGLVIGRNIYQAEDPLESLKKLDDIVHN